MMSGKIMYKNNVFLLALLLLCICLQGCQDNGSSRKVSVELKTAGCTYEYNGVIVVDGVQMTLKEQTFTASESNQVAILVINGGSLVLENCNIVKTGDGKSSQRIGKRGGKPTPPADDIFNFYGLNSAVVAIGDGSSIELRGCNVETNGEYANAVFASDGASVVIKEGIRIRTEKDSSRGLYSTYGGSVKATGVVDIHTKGNHCAAIATDRGGGTVIVGRMSADDRSSLETEGEGSPCVYSTGDIIVYHALGEAVKSQAMVVEGKNSITVEECNFTGNAPIHGGVMLYQSTSGDADEGTCVLNMKNTTLLDKGNTVMFLVTNTSAEVTIDNCKLLRADGDEYGPSEVLIACRNCNGEDRGRKWGVEGGNGGKVEVKTINQKLRGAVVAKEADSKIVISSGEEADASGIKILPGKGSVLVK